jgi:putative tricarboxylic transport membrane protein
MKGGRPIDGADLSLGILALVASAGYLYETAQIPESLLDDAVGARGVPLAFGWTMAVVGALLCLRGLLRRRKTDDEPSADTDSGTALRPHVQALGLLGLLAAYVAVLPFAGYIPSTALLIAAVAWFAGGERNRNLIVVAIAGAVALWLMFDPMLDVSLPAGSWWQRP